MAAEEETTIPNPENQPAPVKKSGRNLSIEGLRGLAALLVLISHINGIAVDKGFAPGWQKTLDQHILTHLGTFGVCAFFCISGYLIIQSLIKHNDLKLFAINRAKRIYPLFIALQLVAFPAALLVKSDLTPFKKEPLLLIQHFISNLFFLPGVFDLPVAQKNAWSLSFEAVFYISAALIFLGLRGKGAARVAGLIGTLVALAMLVERPYAWFFLVGAVVYVYRDWLAARSRMLGGPIGLVAIVAMYLVLPEGWRFVPAVNPMNIEAGGNWAYTGATVYKWLLTLPLAFVFFASVAGEQGWLSAFLRQRWLVWLGAISYSLYLVHPFILHPLELVEKKLGSAGPYIFILGGLALSIAVSAATYYAIEVWLTNRIFKKRTPKPLAPEPTLMTSPIQGKGGEEPIPVAEIVTIPSSDDVILLKPYLIYLWARKYFILAWTAGITAIILLITFINPSVYRASAIIITPSASTVSVGQALAGTASPLSILHGIGDSPTTYSLVAKAAKMTTQEVRDSLDFEEEGVFSQLSITATNRSKAKCELMVKTAMDYMRETSAKLSFTMAEQQMNQLETALDQKQNQLFQAQKEFSEFQKTLKTAPDPANPLSATPYLARQIQIEAQLGTVKKQLEVARKLAAKPQLENPDLPSGIPDRDRFRNQIIQLEYQLQVAQIKGGPLDPEVVRLQRELQVAKKTFLEQVRAYLKSIDGNIDENIATLTGQEIALQWQYDFVKDLNVAAPDEALEYKRRLDEVQAIENTRDSIRKQLEDAKLSSEVYKFVWTVLQEPTVEPNAVNKKFGLIALLGGFAALVIVVGAYCVKFGTKAEKTW